MAEGHVKVTQPLQADHRNVEFPVDHRNPAQTVVAQAVGGRITLHAQNGVVEGLFLGAKRREVVELVGDAGVAGQVPGQNAVNGAIAAAGAHHHVPVVGGETDVGHRAFAAGEISHQRLELLPLSGGDAEGARIRRR